MRLTKEQAIQNREEILAASREKPF